MSRYATPLDMTRLALPPSALVGIPDVDQQAALDAASDIADGYLASRFSLPLQRPFPGDLVQAVCDLGAYLTMKRRGFNPEGDSAITKGYDDAVSWLEGVSRNLITPMVFESAPQTGSLSIPTILSKPLRGW
jgi:phage gp36-like protein